MTPLQQYTNYIEKLKTKGERLLTYTAPCCGKFMESSVPSDNQTWDSAVSCPYCGSLYMKVTQKHKITTYKMPRQICTG